MDKLLGIWAYLRNCRALDKDGYITGTKLLPTFPEAVKEALREAYSEGHCDGQNAADVGDENECPKDIDVAWARSQTQRKLLEAK
jgi:hypothetical protein